MSSYQEFGSTESLCREEYNERRKSSAGALLWKVMDTWNRSDRAQKVKNHRESLRRLALMRKKAKEEEQRLCNDWSGNSTFDDGFNESSIFYQIREANLEADDTTDFIKRTLSILGHTLLVTVLLGCFMTLPITMVTIGVKYIYECPVEPKLPIYLLVGGAFGLLKLITMMWKQIRSRRYERLDDIYFSTEGNGDLFMSKSSRFSENILSLFLFCWFICGNYWVFHIWKPNFVILLHEPSNWCDPTVYLFSLAQIAACYALMIMIAFLVCGLAMCHRYTFAFENS